MEEELISTSEIIMMIVFGMLVPSGDNFSDIWLSYTFFSGTYQPVGQYVHVYNGTLVVPWKLGELVEKVPIVPVQQPIYGCMTIFPVLLSFLITIIHWYQTEKTPNRSQYIY